MNEFLDKEGLGHYTARVKQLVKEKSPSPITTDQIDMMIAVNDGELLFANSIEECTDTSKQYVLPDGYIYAYNEETGEWASTGVMYDDPAEGSEGGGVSSWNDLTDKPFGESENAVLLPPTELFFDGSTFFVTPGYIEFIPGKTYTVNWNGVDYATVCFEGMYEGMLLAGLGNPAAVGGSNNNQPFVIACADGYIVAIPLDGSTAVTVGITGFNLKKLEEKFLPNSAIPFWADFTNTNSTYTTTVTAKELYDAHMAGRQIIARVRRYNADAVSADSNIMRLHEILGNGAGYLVARFVSIYPVSLNQFEISTLEFGWEYGESEPTCTYKSKMFDYT